MSEKDKKISVVTMCKDRGGERLINCLKSLQNPLFSEIIVVNYGSKTPITIERDTPKEMNNIKIVRYDKNIIMNKSHALNLGIKMSSEDYIMTIDCDIILTETSIQKIKDNLNLNNFIIDTNIKRIEIEDLPDYSKAFPWLDNLHRIGGKANGAIQVFPRRWIDFCRGYDENLILWGGIDNDMVNRAKLGEMIIVDINEAIYHQEHDSMKEDNLPADEKERAKYIRKQKNFYLRSKVDRGVVIGDKKWGESEPNQSMFIDFWTNYKKSVKKLENERLNKLQKIKSFILENKIPVRAFEVDWL